jgi:uncharacterized protein (TIGR02466 family)|tara:strand:- start:894 stop:1496 length:603 start_codon:yes stop_codon:yes gene_type:complete
MEHQKIFPTNLFLIEEFYHSDTNVMKKYIFDLWENRDYDNRWQTKSANLHKQKEFKEFTELVISTSKEILDKLKYDVEDIVITDMWANVLKSGENHPAHTHSNNFLSGVYYLHSSQGASIMFRDPRPAADVITPRKKETNVTNASLLRYASKQNRAIFFPSWLQHWVEPNKSTNNRISIAWNIQVKGQVGEHHEFQSANF